MPDRMVEVVDPGALTTIQDLGRPGHAHLGVPRSGVLDAPALMLANRLVGNPEGFAGLETTLTGVTVRTGSAVTFAVTGAPCRVTAGGRDVAWGAATTVSAGVTVRLGPADQGLRSVLALAGGIEVREVLGSRATDLLSGLGPAPLQAGDLIPLGRARTPPDGVDVSVPFRADNLLRLHPGPRADWFTAAAVAALDGAHYTVSAASNRIGLRLDGPPLERSGSGAGPAELPSEPMVLGAVQVPPDGLPVVLLNDHATTGGYPVVAVVPGADLPVCAQLRPGDDVRLVLSPRWEVGAR